MDLQSLIAKMTAIENSALTEGGVVDPVGEIRPGQIINPPARPTKKPEVTQLEKPLDDTDTTSDEKEVGEGDTGRAIGTVAGELVAPKFTPVSGMIGGAIGDKIGDKIGKSHDEEEVEEGWKEKAGAVALAGAAALGGAAPAQAGGWNDIMRPVDQVYQAQRDFKNARSNAELEVSKDKDRIGRDLERIPFFGIDKFGKQMRGNYPYGNHPEPDRSPNAAQRQGQNAARNAELQGSMDQWRQENAARNADLQGSTAATGYRVNNGGYKPYKINNFESKNMYKEEKCTECNMYESKCKCPDELAEMMKLAGRLHPYIIGEAKKKKPDANKNGIPDYAEDGKGKMEEGKKVEEDDVEEGNAFSKAVRDAKKDGIQPGEKIEVGGKKYPVKETTSSDLMKRWRGIFESEEKCADCGEVHKGDCVSEAANKTVDEASIGNAFTAHKVPRQDTSTGKFDKKTTTTGTEYTRKSNTFSNGTEDPRRPAKTMPMKKDKKPLGEAMEECMDDGEGSMDDNFSINSSMDSSGHKSVSITASGSKADELTNILRNAGLGVMGGSEHAEPDADDMGGPSDHDADNMGGGDVEVISIPLAQHDGYQAPESEGEVAEEYSNEPDTQVQPVSTQLRQGNDLNREKQQHKHSYRQGDNPMAMEDQQAAACLEKELMEELSALKVVSEKYMTELSSKALSNYGKKAGKSNDKKLDKAADHTEKATNLYSKGTASAVAKSFDHEDQANKLHKEVKKRGAGMDRAAGKLKNQMSNGMLEMAGIEETHPAVRQLKNKLGQVAKQNPGSGLGRHYDNIKNGMTYKSLVNKDMVDQNGQINIPGFKDDKEGMAEGMGDDIQYAQYCSARDDGNTHEQAVADILKRYGGTPQSIERALGFYPKYTPGKFYGRPTGKPTGLGTRIKSAFGMAEEIIGQPEFDNMDNAGRGVYSGAEKTATTKHRLGSHQYEVTTEQDGDGDLYYFIYVNGKQMFYATSSSGVYEDKLGSRISSALLDEHKKATAQMFDSDEDEDEDDLRKHGVTEAKIDKDTYKIVKPKKKG